MPRLRTLKPAFFTHEVLAELSPLHRLLYQGLWCHADRAGRLEDRPRYLKTVILPYDDCNVDAMLDELQSRGFVLRYVVDGVRLLAIPTFLKHQKPHVRESKAVLPGPGQGTTKAVPKHSPGDAEPGGLLSLGSGLLSLGEELRSVERERAPENSEPPPELDHDTATPLPEPDAGGAEASPRHVPAPTPPEPEPDLGSLKAMREHWNGHADSGLARWEETPDTRRRTALAFLRAHGFDAWVELVERINASDFLCGRKAGASRRFGVDWFLKPANRAKVLEGNYLDARPSAPPVGVRPQGVCTDCGFEGEVAGNPLCCYACLAKHAEARPPPEPGPPCCAACFEPVSAPHKPDCWRAAMPPAVPEAEPPFSPVPPPRLEAVPPKKSASRAKLGGDPFAGLPAKPRVLAGKRKAVHA